MGNLAEKNGQWKGGVNDDYCKRIAFETYPRKCMFCGSLKEIQVHHKDRNRKNNNIQNLAILCRLCHVKVHEHLVDWSKYGNKCKKCGRNDVKHNAKGYCIKCYSQEFMVDKHKQYYLNNKEKLHEKSKLRYIKNRTKILNAQKLRRETDLDYVKYHNHKSLHWRSKNKE